MKRIKPVKAWAHVNGGKLVHICRLGCPKDIAKRVMVAGDSLVRVTVTVDVRKRR